MKIVDSAKIGRKSERETTLESGQRATGLREKDCVGISRQKDRTEMRERQESRKDRATGLRAGASGRTDGDRARARDSQEHCPTLGITAEARDKASEHRRVQQGVWMLYCKILGHASVHMRERVCERQTHLCFSHGSSSVSVSRGL